MQEIPTNTASHNDLRNLLAQAPVAMAIYRGKDHIIEIANKAMCEFWDKQQEAIVGKSLFEVLPEAEQQGFRQVLDQVLATGERATFNEIPVVLANQGQNKTLIYNLLFEALRDTKGSIYGLMGLATDVTASVMARKKIEESERKYRTLIESTDVATALYEGYDMTIKMANDAMINLWGKGPSVIGKNLHDALPEIQNQHFLSLLQAVYETGISYKTNEGRADLLIDGKLETFYFNFSYQALKDADGKVYAILNMAVDVTQSVNDRKKLEEAEDKTRLALAAGNFGVWDSDFENNSVYLDSRCKELFGITAFDDLTPEDFAKYVHPEDQKKIESAIAETIKKGQSDYRIEFRVLLPDNKLRWLRSYGKAYFNANGLSRIVGTSQDITSERESQNEQAKLLALVDNSVELMSLLGLDGKNSYVNKAGQQLLGFDSMAQVIETPISELHAPEDFQKVNDEVLKALVEKGRWSGEMIVRNLKTKELIPVYNNTVRIHDPETGEVLGFGAVMRDMRPELEARRTQQRTNDLQAANTNLKRSNEELEQFAYVASHDLQEPLRKIQMFSDLILSSPNDSDYLIKQVVKVAAASKRMSALVKDLLNYSRLSSVTQDFETVDLNEVMRNVMTDLDLTIKSASAQIHFTGLPKVLGLPLQLYQLLLNLTSNSLKFIKANPIISIRAQSCIGGQGGVYDHLIKGVSYWYLTFEDNGIGFEQEYADKIFTIFQRLHNNRDYSGTGIGLAICKKAVENHHGFIYASSNPGEGATFHIYLPKME
ncbi:histidine kinase [Sphingobacteriaceae bacterium]|nr:histidine kinase [Sphingobacteriaceae bacterium]